jgi:hypothetical protein
VRKAGRPEGLSKPTQRELALASALLGLWRRDGASRTWCALFACDLLAKTGKAHVSDGKIKSLVRKMAALDVAYWTERVYTSKNVASARGEYFFIRGSARLIFLLLAAPNRYDAEECGRGLIEMGWDKAVIDRLRIFARAINEHSKEYDVVGPTSQTFRRRLNELAPELLI